MRCKSNPFFQQAYTIISYIRKSTLSITPTMATTWIIPDIHGCSETLKLMIGQQIKPNKNDRLIFLGDYIDRGPDSKGVIDFIMELERKGYSITALKGNHEDSCIKAWESDRQQKDIFGLQTKSMVQKDWEAIGGKETMKSFEAFWPNEIPEKYIQWMRSLDYYVELDNFIAVHAGFNFNLEDPFSDTYSMLWIRDYQIIPEKINHKKIIHGHTPVNLGFIDLTINNDIFQFIDLDNGVYMTQQKGYGNLIALELNSMEYKIQARADQIR